jgi:hypothetical protein
METRKLTGGRIKPAEKSASATETLVSGESVQAARLREKREAPTLAPLRPNRVGPDRISETPEQKYSMNENRAEIKAMNTRRKISDLEPSQNKMQTRNISLRSKQSLHPIHGGLRPPSLFLIETKIGSLLI